MAFEYFERIIDRPGNGLSLELFRRAHIDDQYFAGSGPQSSQAAKLAQEMGFQSTTFCLVSKWKEQGYQAEPGKKN